MSPSIPAQGGAQLISLILFGLAARWYVLPWLASLSRASALTALLWVHAFRYVALQVFSAQTSGFPISDNGARAIVGGDVAGAFIAMGAILLLRRRSALAIPLVWILIAETAYDTVMNVREGMREHLMGAASGVTWMILAFFVPMVVASTALLVVQLLTRHPQLHNPAPRVANPAR